MSSSATSTRRSNGSATFELLTGNTPFPWQERLLGEFLEGRFPPCCDLPTGLGKTSVIALWMIALAQEPTRVPRRLVYVVNRRTVVDQATREVETWRQRLRDEATLSTFADRLKDLCTQAHPSPFALSTLRGQFADNGEWRLDPSRPAVVVGTVDMIGSRLLFSAYGRGFKSRPLHAGFLGQDVLLVHDEAHLEPAFQRLIEDIEAEQKRSSEFRSFSVMALTATSRGAGAEAFRLDSVTDGAHPEVSKRLRARKGLVLHEVEDDTNAPEEVARLALEHLDSGQAILVFQRTLDGVETVARRLKEGKQRWQRLTGTQRGLERDALAREDPIFARFLPPRDRQLGVEPAEGTVYLVCTSAGEVGVNLSADHMVCDLTPFDSMAQRLGRVNRFGEGDARIDVVHPKFGEEAADEYDERRRRTLKLLDSLKTRGDSRHDCSPASLGELPAAQRQEAFTPPPVLVPTTDILFDSWALTSVRETLPGRPPVADWLHGIEEWEAPQTQVAWREEVAIVAGTLLDSYKPDDLLDEYPLRPHEVLRDRTDRVVKHLKRLESDRPPTPVWVVTDSGSVTVTTLSELLSVSPEDELRGRAILLPPSAGGLEDGFLQGSAKYEKASAYDVSDRCYDEQGEVTRGRVWDDATRPRGMRWIRTIDSRPDPDETNGTDERPSGPRYWHWFGKSRNADDDGSRAAAAPQTLEEHLATAAARALEFVSKLDLREPEATAVVLAAKWHDLGKRRGVWQRSIGNRGYPGVVLAKSGNGRPPTDLNNYRHELGSLLDLEQEADFCKLSPNGRDLVRHLIAAHHGRARPHFSRDESFDPERPDPAAVEVVREAPRRFSLLQRRYGRWGLAYLESLVRAADALASQTDSSGELGGIPTPGGAGEDGRA
ncbi:MAG: type I-U CRISPR-associated helicase/endonuclease Cas3 [Planctomycetes bacterium]|nr:type I-U CRISPR-associated helicase/endonuclease Cas3 [Planctomycetota bacterium]